MLSNPVLEGAVNTEAANLIVTSPRAYRQMIHECVIASQRVEGNMSMIVSLSENGS